MIKLLPVLLLVLLGLGADANCDGHADGPPMRLLLPAGPTPDGLASPAYWQDPRTGLCFAANPGAIYLSDQTILVPCGVVEGAKAKIDAAARRGER